MTSPPKKFIEDEDEFLEDVAAFHEKRGTTFDREGKVSGRPISLHKLYRLVMDRGGYDALSAERMQWRTLVKEFGVGKNHEAVMTFQLKTVYYRNLAAYEIETYWGEVPPPREILEDISAKGGDLRSRTLENFPPPNTPNSRSLAHHGLDGAAEADAQESADEDKLTTPKREKTEPEDLGSAGRYPTRQLRQDPKRTQMYQPDTLPARARTLRATDSPSTPTAPQQPQPSGSIEDSRHPAFDWHDHYKPKQSVALTLRPHLTPGNNPFEFYNRKTHLKAQNQPRLPTNQQQQLRPFLQNQMNGPSIYLRCLYGLRSGVKNEQKFALHHLVKVSYERGDKYKFEGFPFLAESLVEKALEITQLATGAKWTITYAEDDGDSPVNTLNAAFGTPNLLERIQFAYVDSTEVVESDESSEHLERLKEAALVLRNMVILEENALFMSKFPLFKDFLTIAISLPDQPRLAEFRQSALDMCEQVSRYWPITPTDSLYLSLIPLLESNDRSVLMSSLRSINRMGIATQAVHQLTGIPLSTIVRLFSIILLESDVELLEATLTFLYEYTATPDNNTELLSSQSHLLPSMIPRLINLLSYQASITIENVFGAPPPEKMPIPSGIPIIPPDLHAQLLVFPEPERSSKWLRCCFEESPTDDITQIAIWQAYQGRFAQNNPIPAAEFIKNVSNTFTTAQAQVINGNTPRFIIKGIKPRRVLVDLDRKLRFFKCLWEIGRLDPTDPASRNNQKSSLCGQWYSSRENVWNHVVNDHLRIQRTTDGRFAANTVGSWTCRWTLCGREHPFAKANDIGSHVQVHIPKTPEDMYEVVHELANLGKKPERVGTKHAYQYTLMDPSNHPAGIPWMSVMILRNLARYANKPQGKQFEKHGFPLVDQLFGGHKYAIFNIMGVSRTLREYIVDLVYMIEEGERAQKRGVKREHEPDEGEMET